ncbi:translin-associated factor X-interacting protein 1-like [Ptychodera flava]|uniref:translin-associated factor X-interacting protein 1-like n=1 Tax=Ptychodera flava TaxID=63121 RepID=UPI003969D7B1
MSARAVAKLPPIGSNPSQGISARNIERYEGLTGPSYQLSSEKEKFNLPQPTILKAYVDTKSGSLDTWPAHASNQAASNNLQRPKSHDRRLVPVSPNGNPNEAVMPKPKFLEQLEAFLQKELRALESVEVGPSELRLQAYREVFEYLIEDFKTYKPLLSAIKNEYEMMLAYQREEIRHLQPLRSMLVTVSEQCDQKIIALRNEEKQEMTDLKRDKRKLMEQIDSMKEEQLSLKEQIQQLQDEVASEYHKYRDECDARKLLVADINDLRYQQEDYQKSQSGMQEGEEENKEDPVLLKIALKKAREDLSSATQRLNEMIANYGDVVPRRDFEALEKQYHNFQEEMQTMQEDHRKLMSEHDTLLEVHKQVLAQRDEFYQELEQLKRSATPRPFWDKCAAHVEGGEERWKKLSENKNSDQLVDVLLAEIVGGDLSGADLIEGRGRGEDVPKYLRYEGKVKPRKIGKRDLGLLIKDVWREKTVYDNEKNEGKRSRLEDFMYDYLLRRFGLEDTAIEWGYNLLEASERFQEDVRISLFHDILIGKVDEEVYHSQLQTLAKLIQALTKTDAEASNQGSLSKENFEQAVKEFFPLKSEESIEALMNAVVEELKLEEGNNTIAYNELFTEDDEGRNGPFINKIREQEKEERLQYIEDIKNELGEKEEVKQQELRIAISIIDPMIEKNQLLYYLSRAFNVDKDKLDQAEPTETEVVLERLRTGAVNRSGEGDMVGVN